MGTQGLWNYINNHGLCMQPHQERGNSIMASHHLIFDMNALVHGTVAKRTFTSRATIRDTIASIQRIVRLFPPSETLALVFDGVAPSLKLRLQKERRASMPIPDVMLEPPPPPPPPTCCRYNYDYVGTEVPLFREEILTGSEFLLACEDAVRNALCLDADAEGDFRIHCSNPNCVTIVSGCDEAGEGELKIASIIRDIWLKQTKTQSYTGDDVIAVVGGDSDLALVGIACTPYNRYYMVDSTVLSVTSIGNLFEHWMSGAPNGTLPPELLPSYRIDFVFLMLLGGGDWYKGVGGGRTLQLWRHYRDLRFNGGFYRRSLICGETFNIDIEFLRAVTNLKAFNHHVNRLSKMKQATIKVSSLPPAEVEWGINLLKGAIWALKSIMVGHCCDYGFSVQHKEPTVGALMGAAHAKRLMKRLQPTSAVPLPPLSPLEQCVAVMGTRGRYSAEIRRALTTINETQGNRLTESLSVSYMLKNVQYLMASVDRDKLTAAERALLVLHHRDTLGESRDPQQGLVSFMSFTCAPLTGELAGGSE